MLAGLGVPCLRNPQSFSITMTTSQFTDDYSSEDYEDCDGYCVVPKVSQTTHPIDESDNNEAENLMIERPEVPTPRSIQQVMLSSEWDDDDDEVPNMENEMEELDSVTTIFTTSSPATSNMLTALRVIEWTRGREGSRVPIHQLSRSSSPMFICGTILKDWIKQFLFEISRFRIRFYRSIVAAFGKLTGWVTRSTT